MSRYEWESGSIKLPTATWTGFTKAMREEWNCRIEAELATLTRIHAAVAAANKGKRSVNWKQETLNYLGKNNRISETFSVLADQHDDEAIATLLTVSVNGKTKLISSVTKKLAASKYATSKTTSYEAGYAGHIQLDPKTKTVHWRVDENNRARQNAHDSFIARAMFTLIGKIKWTRGTGGYFTGNDEYNAETTDYGAGANYLTSTFGPLGEQAKIDDLRSKGFSLKDATAMVTRK